MTDLNCFIVENTYLLIYILVFLSFVKHTYVFIRIISIPQVACHEAQGLDRIVARVLFDFDKNPPLLQTSIQVLFSYIYFPSCLQILI